MKKNYIIKILLLTILTLNIKGNFIPDKLTSILDLTNYIAEAANISEFDTQSILNIKTTATLSLIKNLGFSLQDFVAILIIEHLYHSFPTLSKKLPTLYQLLSFYFLIDNLKFAYRDKEKFIKSIKLSASDSGNYKNFKLKHFIWLTINSFFPYLALAIKRSIYDKADFKNIFYYLNSKEFTLNISNDTKILSWSRLIINFSENYRRSKFYNELDKRLKFVS